MPKLYIIGSNGVPARYGGFETFAECLSKELSDKLEIYIACSSFKYDKQERSEKWHNIKRKFFPLRANGIQGILYDYLALSRTTPDCDYILILGVGAGLCLLFLSKIRTKKLLIHIDGIEWRREKWNLIEKILLKIGFYLSLKFSTIIIIDNISLKSYIPIKYHSKIRHLVYGGDHTVSTSINKTSAIPYALTIARAEPENNLELILNSFNITDTHLVMISNWNETRYGRRLYKKYGSDKKFRLLGPIYDKEVLQEYRCNCLMHIHGHSAGGTNPSLVEAMYSGKPILAWDNEFNRTTTNNFALYFRSEEQLKKLLTMNDLAGFRNEGEHLKQYAITNYKWDNVANEFLKILNDL